MCSPALWLAVLRTKMSKRKRLCKFFSMLLPVRKEGMWACLTWVEEQPTYFATRTKTELLGPRNDITVLLEILMKELIHRLSVLQDSSVGLGCSTSCVLMDSGKLCCPSCFLASVMGKHWRIDGTRLLTPQMSCLASQGKLESPPI